jgi:hypothetical protein
MFLVVFDAAILYTEKSDRKTVDVNVDPRVIINAIDRTKQQRCPDRLLVKHCLRVGGRIVRGPEYELLWMEKIAISENLTPEVSSITDATAAAMIPV